MAGTAGSAEAPDEIIVALSMAQARQTYEHFWGACAASIVCLADLRRAVERFTRLDQHALADVVVRSDSGQQEAFCVMLDVTEGEGAVHAVTPLLVYARGAEHAVEGALSRFEGATAMAVHPASKLQEFVEALEVGLRGESGGTLVPVVAMHKVVA
jgi:hypothetical protein